MTLISSACYLCGGNQTYDFFDLPPLPTQDGVMSSTKINALGAVRGAIQLRHCKTCGYVGNEGHDSAKVSFDDYDFSNDNSPMYSRYTQELCDRLIGRYDLNLKSIVDIGCGDGEFLRALCTLGNNKGVGIDPGFDHSTGVQDSGEDIAFLREYYSQEHAKFQSDLVTSRHVISISNDPLTLVRLIRKNLAQKSQAVVYFETPNVRYTFGQKIIWNVAYEHRSWFSTESLRYLIELAGFEVLDIDLCWNDTFLYVEARPTDTFVPPRKPDPDKLIDLERDIRGFSAGFLELMEAHTCKISEIKAQGKKTIAWGAGARAVTYFNLFELSQEVPCIVDVNEKRQGKYLPGSGQEIVAPEFIQTYQPELVIITNPTYEVEIREQVQRLGINPEFWVL
ncbi:MAG: SAM-dependent methyltransferase [Halioglobus sp.]|jgi:SAM-dependent methyltransferase